MTYTLRPYQVECLDAIRGAVERGMRRPLIVLATGGGKTVVFSHVRGHLGLSQRMLVLAHRSELLDQAADKIARVNPELRVEVEQADRQASADADVVVASVQTIGRMGCKRLLRLRPDEFSLIVIDEAHHATARSYLTVLEHFGIVDFDIDDKKKLHNLCATGKGPLLLGVTATPERGDGVGLAAVFEEVVYERHLRDMILEGWLVRLRAYRAETAVDLRGVHTERGDYVVSELAEAVNTPARNELVVRCYQAMAWGRRAVAFCADVQHARDLAERFCSDWIPAAVVVGTTPPDERRDILARFASGELAVITNVGVLTEGFDCPEIAALLMCRPTKSRSLYVQMMGRGARLCEGKEDAIVIDFADVTAHALPTAATILGLPPKFDCEGRDVIAMHEQLMLLAEEVGGAQDVLSQSLSIEDARRLMREIPILAEAEARRKEIAAISSLNWLRMPNGDWFLSLPDSTVIAVKQDQLERWQVRITNGSGFNEDLTRSPYLTAVPVINSRDDAMRFADYYVREHFYAGVAVVNTDARWRDQPASDKQRKQLERMRRWRDGLTKGQAADILDSVFSRNRKEPVAP